MASLVVKGLRYALVIPSNNTLSYAQPCHDVELRISQGSERSESEIRIPLVARQAYDNPTLYVYSGHSLVSSPPMTYLFLSNRIHLWKKTYDKLAVVARTLSVCLLPFLHMCYVLF